jgi:hypothetical protein
VTHDIRIRLSGRLAVEIDGVAADLTSLGRLGALAFGYLVAERGRAVSRDELADVVWNGSPPPSWPHALRNTINRVRLALPEVGVASAAGCYSLRLPPGAVVDIEDAAAALDVARSDMSVFPARRAVSLSRDPFSAASGSRRGRRGSLSFTSTLWRFSPRRLGARVTPRWLLPRPPKLSPSSHSGRPPTSA